MLVIAVDERLRLILLYATVATCGISLCICVEVLITGIRLITNFATYLTIVKGYNPTQFPNFCIVAALLGFFVYFFVGFVSYASTFPRQRARLKPLLNVGLVLLLSILATVSILMLLYFVQKQQIASKFSSGFLFAIEKYKSSPKTKEQMDRLQARFECCGSNGYQDWLKTQWYADEFIDKQSKSVKERIKGDKYLAPDVPWSCCEPHVKRPCIHHHVESNNQHLNYDYRKDITLFKIGCTKMVTDLYANFLFTKVMLRALLLWMTTMITIVTFRFAQTSIFTALAEGGPASASVGHLLMLKGKETDKDKGDAKKSKKKSGKKKGKKSNKKGNKDVKKDKKKSNDDDDDDDEKDEDDDDDDDTYVQPNDIKGKKPTKKTKKAAKKTTPKKSDSKSSSVKEKEKEEENIYMEIMD